MKIPGIRTGMIPLSLSSLVILLSGCIHIPGINPQKDYTHSATTQENDTPNTSSHENYAIKYYQWVKTSLPSTIERELTDLQKQVGYIEPAILMVRKALLLSVPAAATVEDEQLALKLLNQVINLPASAASQEARDYWQFSWVWKDSLEQRQELAQASQKLSKELTDSKNTIKELNRENKTYIKQLEELKLIEQNSNERREQSHNEDETRPGQ